jgi:hypothetical protein
MSKFSFKAALVGGVLAAVAGMSMSTAASAETTRADVKAELVQLKQAGYNPASDHTQYPKNIQLAEQRLAEQHRLDGIGYGPSTNGTVASGLRAESEGAGPVYPIDFGRP